MTSIDEIAPARSRIHRVAVVVFDGVVMADFATPSTLFEVIVGTDGAPCYEVRNCAVRGRTACAGPVELRVRHTLAGLQGADTVIVPGMRDPYAPIDPSLVRALRAAHARGARLVSICTGAFALAATGLLDGRRATTHWACAGELARLHPAIEVDPNVLYVDDGGPLSSAGASAALDLCLHLVRRDCGAEIAARTARLLVAPLERPGGQAQFVEPRSESIDRGSLQPLLEWIEHHLDEPLDVESLAARASVSPRTLHRRFAEQTGTTPLGWVLDARVRGARRLLETGSLPIERVAAITGFGSGVSLREHFRRRLGVAPTEYRRAFRA